MAEPRVVIRSGVFIGKYNSMTAYYETHANSSTALRFMESVKACTAFIARHPKACAPYGIVDGKEIRKWRVKGFAISIFFSIDDKGDITLEFIYHQSQNIAEHLRRDVK